MRSRRMKEIQEQVVEFPALTHKHVPVTADTKNNAGSISPPSEWSARLPAAIASPNVLADAESELPSLTKAELAELLFEYVGLNKREAKDMIETFFDEISNALERGESVKLSGFGNFQLRDKSARPGRNPKTGETVPIAARRVVTFHPSQKLKDLAGLCRLPDASS
jgi:integration host factor subunit alpha